MTIGWQEILILVVVIAVLIGPALFRLYRRWDEFQNWKDNRNKDEKF
jgi:Sec-independent protein translocase protein TatA